MIEPAKTAAVASRVPLRTTAIRERHMPALDRNVIGSLAEMAISNRQVRVVSGLRFRSVEYAKRTVSGPPTTFRGRIWSTVTAHAAAEFPPRDSLQGTAPGCADGRERLFRKDERLSERPTRRSREMSSENEGDEDQRIPTQLISWRFWHSFQPDCKWEIKRSGGPVLKSGSESHIVRAL